MMGNPRKRLVWVVCVYGVLYMDLEVLVLVQTRMDSRLLTKVLFYYYYYYYYYSVEFYL